MRLRTTGAQVTQAISTPGSSLSHSTASSPSVMASDTGGTRPRNLTDTIGYALCSGAAIGYQSDEWGRASYRVGGKMASVYTGGTVFRCDSQPPADGFYVAFWTQYTPQSISQPQPINCNHTITLRNPVLNTTANALVIDRCASCVGVGRQLEDPTTSDYYVNGATVDLSVELWNFLFNNASFGVYDVEYDGTPWPGWTAEPSPLTPLGRTQCGSS